MINFDYTLEVQSTKQAVAGLQGGGFPTTKGKSLVDGWTSWVHNTQWAYPDHNLLGCPRKLVNG